MILSFRFALFLLTSQIFICLKLISQTNQFAGSREAGMANSVLTIGGTWSMFHNPAGMASLDHPSAGFSYENQYQVKELSTRSAVANLPMHNGGFGLAYSYFGSTSYNEQKTSLGYAHKLGTKINAGITFDLFSANLPQEYKDDYSIAGQISLLIAPSDQLLLGIHVSNISNSRYFTYSTKEPGAFFRTGATWHEERFLIGVKTSLNKNKNPTFGIGTEVHLVKHLDLRAGISNNDKYNYTFGIGYYQNFWKCDIAIANHQVLGLTTTISLEIHLKRSKNERL